MAFVVAATRRPTYAVLALVGCFLAVAGLYGLLGATFLAAVQIIVYAGAVGVVFLVVIVLLDSSGETSSRERRGGLRWGADVGWSGSLRADRDRGVRRLGRNPPVLCRGYERLRGSDG